MNSMRMLDPQEENEDAEVTWEDQQRINSFSKINIRLQLIEDKLSELKREKEALDDLATELELIDEDEPVLYKLGETFVHVPHAQATELLEKSQADINAQSSALESSAEECEKELKELKVTLYAKFGSSINLDELP